MPTIALVDDDRNILTSVSMALEQEGYHVRTYTDGTAALAAFSATPPDLAVLDIKMPRMDGMEVLRRIRQKSEMPVIFLTSKDEEIDELMALNAGADDYIKKPFSQRLLLERVKAVLRRAEARAGGAKEGASTDPAQAAFVRGKLMMDPQRHATSWDGKNVTLTVTEFLILQALAQRPGFVKSRDHLMDAAYDDQVYVDDRTIDSHIKRLRKKFKAVDDNFDSIETLYGVGYRFKEYKGGGASFVNATASPRDATRLRRRKRGLTRLIIALNLIALLVLIAGTFWLNVRRVGMIDERILSLKTQGAIIAAALAESATTGPEAMGLDDELAVPLLRRLVSQTNARVRLFDRTGQLQLDSRIIVPSNEVVATRLPPPDSWFGSEWLNGIYEWLARWAPGQDYPPYLELQGSDGTFYAEVADALQARPSSAIRVNSSGDLILSVAVPIQRYQLILGVLHLTNEGGDIGAILRDERLAILQLSLVAIAVMFATSLLMARNIARPIRALADAADDARMRAKGRVNIPDFRQRNDEIGELAGALKSMTGALYDRIDAIEQFAADVAHEIKNPLTSLKSAVETMRRATPEQRDRLLAIIEDDVTRVNRLVSDISDASRLDAELAREKQEVVDLTRLAKEVAAICAERSSHAVEVEQDMSVQRSGLTVLGLEGPLGQVVRNLVDNAISFSPEDKPVRIGLARDGGMAMVTVADSGPGIPPEHLEDVFRRFYTSRPEEHFGRNSGLGLSISKQIIDVHGGTITAANLPGPAPGSRGGALFTIRLPLP